MSSFRKEAITPENFPTSQVWGQVVFLIINHVTLSQDSDCKFGTKESYPTNEIGELGSEHTAERTLGIYYPNTGISLEATRTIFGQATEPDGVINWRADGEQYNLAYEQGQDVNESIQGLFEKLQAVITPKEAAPEQNA